MIRKSFVSPSGRVRAGLAALTLPLAAAGFLLLAPRMRGDPVVPVQGPAHGKEVLIVKDNQETKTIDAQGQDLTVTGNRNKITVTGECHALTISGDFNFVNVAAVASISMSGNGNEVAYERAVDGEKPQITSTGKDNVAAKKKVE
jgi:hypothetical protein